MKELTLYSTVGCHLCDEAGLLLEQAAKSEQIVVTVVDISERESLVNEYGIRIPVVAQPEAKQELDWPFTLEQLQEWLAS